MGFTTSINRSPAGSGVDDFAPRLSFFFNAHNDLFEEVAKYRAARLLWADAMRNRYGARDPASWKLRFHAQTAGCALQAQQPEVNLIRVAYQALAAVLGGCQSLHTNSMDETLALPSEHAVTLALRTQQVLAYETGVDAVRPIRWAAVTSSKPCTRQMEAEARAYFERIEQLGGMIKALESGFFRREIAEASFAQQREVEAKRQIVVGVNAFCEPEQKPIELLSCRRPRRGRATGGPPAGQRESQPGRLATGDGRGQARCRGRAQPGAATPGCCSSPRHGGGNHECAGRCARALRRCRQVVGVC